MIWTRECSTLCSPYVSRSMSRARSTDKFISQSTKSNALLFWSISYRLNATIECDTPSIIHWPATRTIFTVWQQSMSSKDWQRGYYHASKGTLCQIFFFFIENIIVIRVLYSQVYMFLFVPKVMKGETLSTRYSRFVKNMHSFKKSYASRRSSGILTNLENSGNVTVAVISPVRVCLSLMREEGQEDRTLPRSP